MISISLCLHDHFPLAYIRMMELTSVPQKHTTSPPSPPLPRQQGRPNLRQSGSSARTCRQVVTFPKYKADRHLQSILQSHSNTPEAQSESESDDEGSEVDAQSASESSGTAASVTSSKRETKRIRAKPATNDVKPKRQSVDRKPSVTVPKAGSSEPLPKARQHVQLRMAEVVKGLFGGSMEDQEAVRYAGELEAALWTSFKEVLNGKDATGSRYK